MGIPGQIFGKETDVVHMVFDGFFTPACLLQPALKAIQDRLAGELDRSARCSYVSAGSASVIELLSFNPGAYKDIPPMIPLWVLEDASNM